MNEKPIILVIAATLSASLGWIQVGLSIGALIITILYTAWKWRRDWKRTKK